MRALFDPAVGLRERVVGFEALAGALLARVRREADIDPEEGLQGLASELARLGGPLPPRENALAQETPVAMPVHLRHRGVDLR